jgi:hypothetical protein
MDGQQPDEQERREVAEEQPVFGGAEPSVVPVLSHVPILDLGNTYRLAGERTPEGSAGS